MSYGLFLVTMIGIPITVLFVLLTIDTIAYTRRKRLRSMEQGERFFWKMLVLLVGIAFVYTTPWDNYLVRNGVWYYDPALVSGIVWGWVPIEEYMFFILQTVLVGLWMAWLNRIHSKRMEDKGHFLPIAGVSTGALKGRLCALCLLLLLWFMALGLFLRGGSAWMYTSLILLWALPPLMLQIGFGGDLLSHKRRFLFWAIAVPTVYLWIADTLAISSGTWTIDPAHSLQLYLPGGLPVEEALFFLMTTVLIAFGLTLATMPAAQERLMALGIHRFKR